MIDAKTVRKASQFEREKSNKKFWWNGIILGFIAGYVIGMFMCLFILSHTAA